MEEGKGGRKGRKDTEEGRGKRRGGRGRESGCEGKKELTLDHAKSLLAERHTTLDTADAVGLSGSGRLHDLFVRWEAMSPGDFARGGAGLTITWGWVDSPFGLALLMATGKGICGIGFAAETGREAAMADMVSRWPKATCSTKGIM